MNRNYFHFTRESKHPDARLFCFHYAGGSPYAYVSWQKYINHNIDVFPFQMAGRCGRSCEKYSRSIEAVACEAAAEIKKYSDRKIIFTGHSMGGIVAYYAAYLLKDLYNIKVERLFITASIPDLGLYIRGNYGSSEHFCDSRFCEMLLKFGAVDKRVMKVRGFREQFLPMIRSDFQLIENYRADLAHIIDSDITVFCGDCDHIANKATCREWKKFTNGKVSVTECTGDHFFIKNHVQEICSEINCCIS